MGQVMSRYDDVRLVGDGELETRRESFWLRLRSIHAYKEEEDLPPTLEIAYKDVPRLRELLDVAEAAGVGQGELQPPTAEQAEEWRQEEDDAELVKAGDALTDDDLRRLLQLRDRARP